MLFGYGMCTFAAARSELIISGKSEDVDPFSAFVMLFCNLSPENARYRSRLRPTDVKCTEVAATIQSAVLSTGSA